MRADQAPSQRGGSELTAGGRRRLAGRRKLAACCVPRRGSRFGSQELYWKLTSSLLSPAPEGRHSILSGLDEIKRLGLIRGLSPVAHPRVLTCEFCGGVSIAPRPVSQQNNIRFRFPTAEGKCKMKRILKL